VVGSRSRASASSTCTKRLWHELRAQEKRVAGPSDATIKQLFAVSSDTCALPDARRRWLKAKPWSARCAYQVGEEDPDQTDAICALLTMPAFLAAPIQTTRGCGSVCGRNDASWRVPSGAGL
jgi:hypothetical protein